MLDSSKGPEHFLNVDLPMALIYTIHVMRFYFIFVDNFEADNRKNNIQIYTHLLVLISAVISKSFLLYVYWQIKLNMTPNIQELHYLVELFLFLLLNTTQRVHFVLIYII